MLYLASTQKKYESIFQLPSKPFFQKKRKSLLKYDGSIPIEGAEDRNNNFPFYLDD